MESKRLPAQFGLTAKQASVPLCLCVCVCVEHLCFEGFTAWIGMLVYIHPVVYIFVCVFMWERSIQGPVYVRGLTCLKIRVCHLYVIPHTVHLCVLLHPWHTSCVFVAMFMLLASLYLNTGPCLRWALGLLPVWLACCCKNSSTMTHCYPKQTQLCFDLKGVSSISECWEPVAYLIPQWACYYYCNSVKFCD